MSTSTARNPENPDYFERQDSPLDQCALLSLETRGVAGLRYPQPRGTQTTARRGSQRVAPDQRPPRKVVCSVTGI